MYEDERPISATPPGSRLAPLKLRIHQLVKTTLRIQVEAEFQYDTGDPLVVSVRLRPPCGGPVIIWRISRDLLLEGTHELSGGGDVSVWPYVRDEGSVVCLLLAPREGSAYFEIPGPLAEWLQSTYDVIPPGSEFDGVDWDALALGFRRDG